MIAGVYGLLALVSGIWTGLVAGPSLFERQLSGPVLIRPGASSLPFLIGALLLWRRPRAGTVVVTTAAAVTLALLLRELLSTVEWMAITPDAGQAISSAVMLLVLVLVLAGLGVAAWLGRPRDGWLWGGEVPGWALVPFGAASLPLLLHTVGPQQRDPRLPAPVGYLRALLQPIDTPASLLAMLLLAVLVVGLAVVLLRVGRGVAGVILLTFAGPQLAFRVVEVWEVANGVAGWFAPPEGGSTVIMPGWLGLLGALACVIIGVWWVRQDDPVGPPFHRRADEVGRDQHVP